MSTFVCRMLTVIMQVLTFFHFQYSFFSIYFRDFFINFFMCLSFLDNHVSRIQLKVLTDVF